MGVPVRLGSIGERAAIGRIRAAYGYGWPDSDCSYVPMGSKYLLVTTDSLAERTHVPRDASAEDVGYFFAAANLSDIAAMGGIPKYFMEALVLPRSMDAGYLDGMQRGIRRCLDKYGVRLIGGDLKEGTEMVMTGIAIGEVGRKRMMLRTRVRPGEALCVTGRLGRNAAGYHMWMSGKPNGAHTLLGIEPRLQEGQFLSRNGIAAAMDLSDGVYSAIGQLNASTGHGFEISYDNIPVDPLAARVSESMGIDKEELCLNFGGEYELLFTAPQKKIRTLIRSAARRGLRISVIGRVSGSRNVLLRNGKRTGISKKGYEHFSRAGK